MVRTKQDWLDMIHAYLDDKASITELAKKYSISADRLKYKIKLYQLHGDMPFADEQEKRVYTREEKLQAIKDVMSGHVSGRQMALDLGIPDPDTINDWIALFKAKGPDAIQISRGRKSYMLHADRQKYLADKEMKARLNHLELENAYLKKSLALSLKKNNRSKKK